MFKNTITWILLIIAIPVLTLSQPVIKANAIDRQQTVTDGNLRFLVLRAEFVPDELATTTGTGEFDMGTESDYQIDKPPHNRTYFQHQMLALKNYFSKVSNKKLVIDADVLPQGEDQAYKLAENMVYYSGQEDDSLKNVRWSELLRDVIALAKAQDNPDFSLYDGVIVFHAGVGSDFAFDFDATPYDIQSVYLDLETLRNALGNGDAGYSGIDVGNGIYIKDGIILPEMQTQEDYNLGLFGTMTLLMGSKLGMPSLFNTETGDPGIGRWGLMDQGSYNMTGLIPAYPCAWMKTYMGWEEPVTMTNGTDLKIGTVYTSSAPHLYKIPISATEYYLIENRQIDSNGDKVTFGRDEFGHRAQFDTLGNVVAESGLGVITRVDEYDFGLPGSGLLIWYIDESVIQANLATNTINNDREDRGVDLVECDGAQDIGYYYGDFSAASGTESGDYYDPWWAGNESHEYVNNQTDTVALAPNTIPNSNAKNGSKTHIHIYNISNNDSVMTFSVKNDRLLPGFPSSTGADFFSGSLKEVNYKGQNAIIALSSQGKLFGWTKDGAILPPLPAYPLLSTSFLSFEGQFNLPPAAADLDGDGSDELFLLSTTGILNVVGLKDDSYAVLQTVDFQAEPTAGPMIVENGSEKYITIGTKDGKAKSVNFDGDLNPTFHEATLSDQPVTGLATNCPYGLDVYVIDIAGNDAIANPTLDVFVSIEASSAVYLDATLKPAFQPDGSDVYGALVYYQKGGGTTIWKASASGRVNGIDTPEYEFQAGPPALGDVDGDGLVDVLVHIDDQLAGYNTNDVPVPNFPVAFKTDKTEKAASPLFISTTNNDRVTFNVLADGKLVANDNNGKVLDGYPFTAGNGGVVTPLIFNWEPDNSSENAKCALIDADGYLYIWDLDLSVDKENSWSQFGSDKYNRFLMTDQDFTYQTSESQLLPKDKVYCYPNPASEGYSNIRYRLTRAVSAVEIRIYDIAGELVTELTGTGTTPGDHEVRWDLNGIQSGPYLARVQVSDGSETAVEFIKIAVIK